MVEVNDTTTTPIVRRTIAATTDSLPTSLHPILKRVYLARQVTQARDLERSLAALLPYQGLKGIDTAAPILAQALAQQQRIVIVADFDADGATSCAVALRALRALGARHVDFIVPNRFEYGYGLTPEIVQVALAKQPQLIITVDNGISSLDGVAFAKSQGITVVITDHHLPGATLPAADAIVNPNQPGCSFASKAIAGVGVIFYLMLALRAQLREQNWFVNQGIAEPNLATWLDLVALGTVADVVALDHNNRILVTQGLARIRARQASPGILALLKVAGREPERMTTMDFGFCVAPRLNAAGRLDDMSVGIQCLLADDAVTATQLASQLDQLNRERRTIEATMREEAIASLQQLHDLDDVSCLPFGLCVFDANWHEGVIGIVAGRLKERLHRPVIVFAPGKDGLIKGSARSVPGLHIRDVLDEIAALHPALLHKFGGHAMAAGLTLREADFNEFRVAFDTRVRAHVTEADLQRLLLSDGDLTMTDLTLDLAELLRNAGPWGQGFPEPRFDGVFEVVNSRIVGTQHLKLTVRPAGAKQVIDAIYFNIPDSLAIANLRRVQLVYRLDVNEYQGQRTLQLLVEYLQVV